jgi:hypothetical protein
MQVSIVSWKAEGKLLSPSCDTSDLGKRRIDRGKTERKEHDDWNGMDQKHVTRDSEECTKAWEERTGRGRGNQRQDGRMVSSDEGKKRGV